MPEYQMKTVARAINVLVVEDDMFNQELAIDLLSSLGHTGVVVGDGEQALRCLASRQFDVERFHRSLENARLERHDRLPRHDAFHASGAAVVGDDATKP